MRSILDTNLQNYGLAGVKLINEDQYSEIGFRFKEEESKSYFTSLKIFGSENILQNVQSHSVFNISEIERNQNFTEIRYTQHQKDFKLKTEGLKQAELYGFYLENGENGVIYNACGANGATFESFLRCNNLDQQLSIIQPEIYIISLGTNDAFILNFDVEKFEINSQKLIDKLLAANPNALLILTTPADNLIFKKHENHNNVKVKNCLLKFAQANENIAVWDLHTIMGGIGSCRQWYQQGLLSPDFVHFTKKGYELQAELFLKTLVLK